MASSTTMMAGLPGPAAYAAAPSAVPVMTGAQVSPAVHMDQSPPLRAMPVETDGRQGQQRDRHAKQLERPGATQSSTPGTAGPTSTLAIPSPSLNFDGVGNGFSGPAGAFTVNSAPPDPVLAVGPNHVVQVVNQSFAVFNKSGTAVFGPVSTNTLWAGFGGGCQTNNDGDGIVEYDSMADRWVITQFSVSTTPFLQCVAVSTTGDPTGSYNRYSFGGFGSEFPDYPKLSVWPDAYYITFNMFNSATGTGQFLGGRVCAYDRNKILTGAAATQQCFGVGINFGGLLPSDLVGSKPPPAGSPNYILALGAVDGQLAFWKFHVDWTTPANTTLTGPTTLTTAPFTLPCSDTGGTCVPQLGTSQQLDTLGDRLMFRLAYRNFGDHEALVVNHSVTAGTSVGVRWYELRSPATTPVIFQQGTYAPDSSFRWMGSIGIDQSGNMGLGFSISSGSRHPGIHYTGRLATDPLGTMAQGEGTLIDGAGSQTTTLSRWGDYSAISVDPSDDCTFWYTSEYIPSNGTFNWSTRVGAFKFASCGAVLSDFSISATPSSGSVPQGAPATSTIGTTITSGAAQPVALTASGAPSGATVSFNPPVVTSGNSSTMTISTAATTPAGTYLITVTGTGTFAIHSTTYTLTVVANDFSISASPTSGSVGQGGSTMSTIGTTTTSGNPQQVSLSASGAPSGATVSFNPPAVTSGNSSTMTISTAATTPAGTYLITVTGSGTSATHSTSFTLTVVANDFSISANPTSGSVGQGGSTTSTIGTTTTSGNPQQVSLSASGAPSGATVSFNPPSVTSGGSSQMTVTTSSITPLGTFTITITGQGTSATHSTTYTLTVVANDFSISASPASGSVRRGDSITSTITIKVTSGNPQTVKLSASGLPSGATASFNPAAITGNGSSTLTLTTAHTTPPGTYTITVTGTGTSATHSTTYTLTVRRGRRQ